MKRRRMCERMKVEERRLGYEKYKRNYIRTIDRNEKRLGKKRVDNKRQRKRRKN
jgi:hypothetical protein